MSNSSQQPAIGDAAGAQGRSLLLISLGPVQEFIASARRCQDLWYGSWLLSDLARAVAKALEAEAETDLIFPPGLGQSRERENVANKILVEVPTARVRDLAEAAKAAMGQRLEEHAQTAFAKLKTHCDGSQGLNREVFNRDNALRQVRGLMEMQWVATPVGGAGYGDARKRAEASLAARKNTRNWDAWNGVAGVPKSSLDGVRESVLHEVLFGRGLAPKRATVEVKPHLPAHELRRRYYVKPAERLCGVGLLKRLGCDDAVENPERPAFHSTSHMAAAPLLVRLAADEAAQVAWEAWMEALQAEGVDLSKFRIRPGELSHSAVPASIAGAEACQSVPRVWPAPGAVQTGYDGYLLFPSRVAELVEDYSTNSPDKHKDSIKNLRRAQLLCLRALGCPSSGPPAYYAVLLADGDRMGKAIDGLFDIDQHKALGEALAGFATHCRQLVEGLGGSLVYSGGDDVLALLPLHTALRCADALQQTFAERIQHLCPQATAETPHPTLSVGLAIAHHLVPMADALELARHAEKAAKGNGRNSLAVLCSKRSGGTLKWVAKWSEQPVAELAKWAGRFLDGSLPHSAAFDLEDGLAKLQIGLEGKSKTEVQELYGVAQALAKRSAGRRRGNRGSTKLNNDAQIELASALQPETWPQDAEFLAAKLQLARLFAEVARAAWGDAAPQQEAE